MLNNSLKESAFRTHGCDQAISETVIDGFARIFRRQHRSELASNVASEARVTCSAACAKGTPHIKPTELTMIRVLVPLFRHEQERAIQEVMSPR
jgi:hypothetical protein